MYWHGLLNYDNRDNRRLAELRRTHEDLGKIQCVAGAKYAAKVAVLCDYDNEWDGIEDKWHGPLRGRSMDALFKALQRAHIPFDFVNIDDAGTSAPLGGYDAVFYPHPTIITEARTAQLEAYVQAGGRLVIGCRAGYKDINGQCPMTPMPGLLAKLTGCTVEEFTFLGPADAPESIDWAGTSVPAPVFNDVLCPETPDCTVLGTYVGNYYDGKPGLTAHPFGSGAVYAFGAVFTEAAVRRFTELLGVSCPEAGLELPEGVELAVREQPDGRRFVFLLNYLAQPQTIRLRGGASYTDRLTGRALAETETLEPYGVLILESL